MLLQLPPADYLNHPLADFAALLSHQGGLTQSMSPTTIRSRRLRACSRSILNLQLGPVLQSETQSEAHNFVPSMQIRRRQKMLHRRQSNPRLMITRRRSEARVGSTLATAFHKCLRLRFYPTPPLIAQKVFEGSPPAVLNSYYRL